VSLLLKSVFINAELDKTILGLLPPILLINNNKIDKFGCFNYNKYDYY